MQTTVTASKALCTTCMAVSVIVRARSVDTYALASCNIGKMKPIPSDGCTLSMLACAFYLSMCAVRGKTGQNIINEWKRTKA